MSGGRAIAAALVLSLAAAHAARAQDAAPPPPPPPTHYQADEPASTVVAVAGVLVASAGFGLMLRTTEPCYCTPRTAWVIGGLAVVAAGVTLTWLGLRARTVTIAPDLGPHHVGAAAAIRWGGSRARAASP